jgi:hypothetical protein
VRAESAGELLDLGAAGAAASSTMSVAPNSRTSACRSGMPAHRADSLDPQLLRREDAEQPDGSVADHGDRLARADPHCDGGEPSGAQHV